MSFSAATLAAAATPLHTAISGVSFRGCCSSSGAAPERLLRRSFSDDPSSSSSSSCIRRGASRKVVFVPAAAKKSLVEGISPDTPQQSSRVATRRARKTVGYRRGKGWRNTPEPGTERVPQVLSPEAAALARNLLQQQDIRGGIWHVLDALPRGSQSWEDLLNAVAHLRRQKEWQRVIQVYEWVLQTDTFKADVGCYNMLMDAYGRTRQWLEAENTFASMKRRQCVPTETSFNILMAAYSRGGQLERAEQLFNEMQEHNYFPGLVTYHTYLEVLGKRGKYREAEQVFLTMERVGCLPITSTYTLMINIYGRVSHTLLPMLICILSVKTLL
jgi:pentatricopeptide repeat protein